MQSPVFAIHGFPTIWRTMCVAHGRMERLEISLRLSYFWKLNTKLSYYVQVSFINELDPIPESIVCVMIGIISVYECDIYREV